MPELTYAQQWDWVTQQEHDNPYWADTEMQVRRQAAEVMDRLHAGNSNERVRIAIMRPRGASVDGYGGYITLDFPITFPRIGGIEELLLIEHSIREAMKP